MSNLRTSIIVDLAGNLEQKGRRFTGSLERMGRRGTKAMAKLRRGVGAVGQGLDRLGNRYTAMLTGMGATYVATQAIMNSGQLDKGLIRTAQTARATAKATRLLRKEMHAMAKETGQSVEVLKAGFDSLIQSGFEWEEALATIMAINPAMGVTGAQGTTLASALGVGGEIFDKDMSKLEVAVEMLDQMTVAGRLGNAELEDLSAIFSRIGGNAKKAGLSYTGTLGFTEGLSIVEKNPERLATLADSTLRLFTNDRYRTKAQNVTGVNFYNKDKSRRSAFDVLDDLAAKFKNIKTDQEQDKFLAKAFEGADLDTIKGLRILLDGDALQRVRAITAEIEQASGTIARDLPGALDNMPDQLARVKAALSEAADEFAQPINETIKNASKHLLDKKGLSGKEMLAGGALGAAGLFGLVKGGGKLLSKVGGVAGGLLGKTLGMGKTPLPVYVVNKHLSMLPGKDGFGLGGAKTGTANIPKPKGAFLRNSWLTRLAKMGKTGAVLAGSVGAAGLSTTAAGVLGAGAAGYGTGTLIDWGIGKTMGWGSSGKYSGSGSLGAWLYDALHKEQEPTRTSLDVNLTIDSEGRPQVTDVRSSQDNTTVNIDSGMTMQGAGQ